MRIFDEAKAKELYVGFLGFKVDWSTDSSVICPCTCRSRETVVSFTCRSITATPVQVRRCGSRPVA
jgi:hypothetical protein